MPRHTDAPVAASGAGDAADTERTVVRYVVNSPELNARRTDAPVAASGAGGAADTERTVVRYVVNSPELNAPPHGRARSSQWCWECC